jgi:hypothetical protein
MPTLAGVQLRGAIMKQPFSISRRLRSTDSKHGHQVYIRVRGLTKSAIEIPVRDYVGDSYVTLSVHKKHWKGGFISGGRYHKSPRDVNTLMKLVEYDVIDAITTLLSENVKITYENVLKLTYAHKEQDIINEERIKKGDLIVREDGGAFESEDDFLEFLERQDDPKFIPLKRKAGLLKRQYLMDYWDDYIDDSRVKSHKLIKSSILRYIEKDDANIYAGGFNDEWLKQYFIYTIKTGYEGRVDGEVVTKHYEISTIEKYLKILRSFGDYLFDEGVLDNQTYKRFKLRSKKKGQSILKYNADPFKNTHALLKKDFDHLFGFKFVDETLDRVRDIFILQVWLGGLRKKDFYSLSDSNFSKDSDGNMRVWFSQKKTSEDVMNPVNRSYLEPIFKKYNYSLPKFPTESKYNKKIKAVFKAAGLCEKLPFKYEYAKDDAPTIIMKPMCEEVSNRWARNCAVSILCELGHPDNHIKEFTGHRDEKMLQHYRSIHKNVVVNMLDKTTPSVAYNSIEE